MAYLLLLFIFPIQAWALEVKELLRMPDVIWGLDFIDESHAVFTQREGKIFLFDLKNNKAQVLTGVPKVVAKGQGGMLDIRVAPDFVSSRQIYFTYATENNKGLYSTAMASARLTQDAKSGIWKLEDIKEIFVADAWSDNLIHFGSRLEFWNEGILMTVGDRNERELAQSHKVHNGKVLFLSRSGQLKEIFTLGHRNPQGLVIEKSSGRIFEAEFGPRGGDEVNILVKGKNYGWPVVTHGREYWGPKIGEGVEKAGMEAPFLQWTPSISPSAIAIYEADRFAEWKGSLFLANLSSQHVRRVDLKSQKQEELLKEKGWRVRAIRVGSDGYVYIGTDQGHLVRLGLNKAAP